MKPSSRMSVGQDHRLLNLNQQVFASIWSPIKAHLSGANHLIVSPDGSVGTLPLGVIQEEHGRYLVEDYKIGLLQERLDIWHGSNWAEQTYVHRRLPKCSPCGTGRPWNGLGGCMKTPGFGAYANDTFEYAGN